MEIRVKEIKIVDREINEEVKFKKFFDNSYTAAIRRRNAEEIGMDWEALFFVESEEEEIDTLYYADTTGNFFTNLTLEGYLDGEVIEIDEEVELHLTKEGNNLLEAFAFMEIKKLKVLPEDKLKALEYSMFPKFAKGYIAKDLKEDENVLKFSEVFLPLLKKLGILQKIKVTEFNYGISGSSETIQDEFKNKMGDYLFDELAFIYYDRGFGEYLSKQDFNELLIAGSNYKPDMKLLDMYE